MKPIAAGPILEKTDVATALECLRYALSLAVSVVITGMERLVRLEQALAVARGFRAYSEEEIAALLARTVKAAIDGKLERYKSSHDFDGTRLHPEWLG